MSWWAVKRKRPQQSVSYRCQTAPSFPLRLFFKLANDHRIHALADRKCKCDADLAPTVQTHPLRWLPVPGRKLRSLCGARVPVRLTRGQTKPRQGQPWAPPLRWIAATGQNTVISAAGISCKPPNYIPLAATEHQKLQHQKALYADHSWRVNVRTECTSYANPLSSLHSSQSGPLPVA